MWKLFSLIRTGRYEYGQRAKVERQAPKVRRSGKRGRVKTPVRIPRAKGGKNGGTQRHS